MESNKKQSKGRPKGKPTNKMNYKKATDVHFFNSLQIFYSNTNPTLKCIRM